MLLASVALIEATRSFDRLYHYKISLDEINKAAPGMRVIVPFGHRNQQKAGWIIEVWEGEEDKKLKEISQIVDDAPLLSSEMIKMAQWIKTRYFCTWGDAIRLMIPAGVNLKKQRWLQLTETIDIDSVKKDKDIELSQSQMIILDKLAKSRNGVPEQEFDKIEGSFEDISYLIERGIVERCEFFEQPIGEKTVKAIIPSISRRIL